MKRVLLTIIAFAIVFNVSAQLLNENFESTPGALPAGWLTVTPSYGNFATTWHPNNYGGNNCVRASSYSGGNYETEQWLITPVFSSVDATSLTFSFDNEKAAYPGNPMQVFISTDFLGDSASFASATWTEITGLNLSTGTYEWVNSTSDLSSYIGNATVYIAFKYTSTATEGAVWDVDNVSVTTGTGIADINPNFRISPNPANSVLNISSVSNINQISISNIIGQKVLSINSLNTKNYVLDIRSMKNGVYIIAIKNSDGMISLTKFVKE